jgi:hypothetical protein
MPKGKSYWVMAPLFNFDDSQAMAIYTRLLNMSLII